LTNKEREILSNYLPENALDIIKDYQEKFEHQLKISKKRATKLGDYRPPNTKFNYHRISVNHDLNKYSFLITYIHEIAHLICWEEYGRHVKPHGEEWKNIYKNCLLQCIEENCFSDDLVDPLYRHLNNPAASSCVDMDLQKELAKHDVKEAGVKFVEDLPQGAYFVTRNGKLFQKLEKRTKRFKCKEIHTNKLYLFSPIAEVMEYDMENKKLVRS